MPPPPPPATQQANALPSPATLHRMITQSGIGRKTTKLQESLTKGMLLGAVRRDAAGLYGGALRRKRHGLCVQLPPTYLPNFCMLTDYNKNLQEHWRLQLQPTRLKRKIPKTKTE